MPKAVLNGSVIAESDATAVVEGNHYFPPDSVKVGARRSGRRCGGVLRHRHAEDYAAALELL